MRTLALALALAPLLACGAPADSPPGPAAAAPDPQRPGPDPRRRPVAPPEDAAVHDPCRVVATATVHRIDSARAFPDGGETIGEFDPDTLAAAGIEARGVDQAGGSLIGNRDAPFDNPFAALARAELRLPRPATAVGISVADIDFVFNERVDVILEVYDEAGAPLGSICRGLLPAQTWDDESRLALFVGLRSERPVRSVILRAAQRNVTAFDNLRLAYVATGGAR